jgi:membrane-bound serine protease (ClpP class)
MAPGTSIGAASPINAGGEGGGRDKDGKREDVGLEKAEKFTTAFIEAIAKQRKRNVEWAAKAVREAEAVAQDEALKLGVIDVVAADVDELFRAIEGREVEVAGKKVALHLAGAERAGSRCRRSRACSTRSPIRTLAFLLVMAGCSGSTSSSASPA